MKLPNLQTVILVAMMTSTTIALTGCGGGGNTTPLANTTTPFFSTAPAAITVSTGKQSSYSLGGGGGGLKYTTYTVTSSNPEIAQATISGTDFTITGAAPGTATISVQDAAGASIKINAIVTPTVVNTAVPYISAPTFIYLAEAATTSFPVGGGDGNYSAATSDATVATAEIVDSKLKVIGVRRGNVNVAVFDGAGKSASLTVAVGDTSSNQPLFTTMPQSVTLAPAATPAYVVSGGVGPYTATSSNMGVVTASAAQSSVQLKGVAPGTATVIISDAIGAKLPINVVVQSNTVSVPFFTTAPSDVTLGVKAVTYRLLGGTGPYLASSSDSTSIFVSVDNDQLVLTSLRAGATAQIAVFDSTGAAIRFSAKSQ